MAEQPTHIATLAAELSDLWVEIRRADDAGLTLPETHVVNTFRDEASIRAHCLEDYILTCQPQSLGDVAILLNLLLPSLLNIQIADKDVPVTMYRTLVEILTFIEQQNGKPTSGLEGVLPAGRPRTWSEEIVHVRAHIERNLPKAKPAAAGAIAS